MMKEPVYEKSLEFHEKLKGKIALESKIKIKTKEDLSLAYTPGVAEPCLRIHENKDEVYRYTRKSNFSEERIIPGIFDQRVAPSVASAVAQAAIESGVARLKVSPEEVAEHTRELVGSQ